MTDATELLGLTENEATSLIEANGDFWRIRSRDGIENLFEANEAHADNRFNLHLVDGDVVNVDVF